jgi:hypothetical protein
VLAALTAGGNGLNQHGLWPPSAFPGPPTPGGTHKKDAEQRWLVDASSSECRNDLGVTPDDLECYRDHYLTVAGMLAVKGPGAGQDALIWLTSLVTAASVAKPCPVIAPLDSAVALSPCQHGDRQEHHHSRSQERVLVMIANRSRMHVYSDDSSAPADRLI